MHKKKILVLASTFPRWKSDTTPPFVLELEKRLTEEFEITVLAPHFPGAKKSEVLEGLEVKRFQYFWPETLQKLCYEGGILPNIKKNKLLVFQGVTLILFELFSAAKIIRRKRIQLIHAHWIIPQGIIAYILKILFGVPYIITTHGGDIYGLQNKYLISAKRKILKNAKAITVVSTAIKEEMLRTISPELTINVLSMGVDSTLFNPDKYREDLKSQYSKEGPILLFVGRLVEKKGTKYVIEAMPKIIKSFPGSHLLIIGEGTLKNELEKLVKEKELDKYITFLGPIPNHDLPKYYASSDIFIGPSIMTDDGDTEGLGLTFVEAALSKCIPIGSKIGGIPDIVKDKETGMLVKQKNADDIAEKVISILKDKTLMGNLKNQARSYAKDSYDWKIISGKYSTLYQ